MFTQNSSKTHRELIDRGQVPFMENATSSSSMIHLNYRRVHVSIARPRLNFTTCSTPFHCQITLAPSPSFFLLSSYEHPNTSLYHSINSLSFTFLNLFEVVRFHHPMRMWKATPPIPKTGEHPRGSISAVNE